MKLQEQAVDTITINPEKKATHSIIWLHGLGADGNDFAPIVPELKLPPTSAVRFIFPHAPIMPVTLNNGYKMRAWFDIYDTSLASRVDEGGINNACTIVGELVAREMASGIPSENVILAGFSQGAVVALSTGLRFELTLGGIIALSGFLPLADKVLAEASQANKATPIFIAHGSADPVVPYDLGQATAHILQSMHYPASWHSYPMPHSVCADEVKDISEWIQERW